jgi:2-polyprenyl-3-methyl-5-hydroxy-6-metoxy-1,4-benzoquinol methylase
MAVFRTSNEHLLTFYKNDQLNHHFEFETEWMGDDVNRIDEPAWQQRYDYEADLLKSVIEENKFKTIIELGSGPGELSQKIMDKCDIDLDYTLIDRIGAKQVFENRNYKGKFFVKDMLNDLDTSGLRNDYDFLITNDFLEHIYNPSLVVQKSYSIIKDGGKMFVSVPNWRMGHTFSYRGLFDYDNFVYFMYTHGFNFSGVAGSPLRCQSLPKISSEETMDDALITSWNWYMLFDKISVK